MKSCERCQSILNEDDGREFHSKILCEDCYTDEVVPKMSKPHYDNNTEFMQRQKDSYSVRKQQYR